MTQKNTKHRTAMTAIAAVIALSSTPALAQDASVPDPAIETTAPAADPLAPDPVAAEAPAPSASETPPPSKPKVEATTAKSASTTRRSASTSRASTSKVAASSARAAPVAPAAEAPAEVPLPPIASEPAPAAAPIAAPQPEPATPTIAMDEAIPIAGAAGLGLLALAGAGLAMRRRRRRREDAEFAANQWALDHTEPQPQPATVRPEPAFARTPGQEPVQSAGPATPLPAGFDLSRFGRHVQAAYRGPTADNPSLSLKNRLRRASFFDQQERRAAKDAGTAASSAKPAWMSRKPNESEFMFRPAPAKAGLKPALQK